jgi:hypothetical protein
MKTFVVLLMMGVISPAHPDYAEYVARSGHAIVFVKKVFSDVAECAAEMDRYSRTANDEHIAPAFARCIELRVDMGGVQA